jgi:hypothetical protein
LGQVFTAKAPLSGIDAGSRLDLRRALKTGPFTPKPLDARTGCVELTADYYSFNT